MRRLRRGARGRGGARGGAGLALVALLHLVDRPASAAPPETEPTPTPGALGLPRPPGLGEPGEGTTGGVEVDPARLQEERQLEFDLHLFRAQRFEREGKIDDGIREYTAALRLQPGDPGALRGRAHLRFKRTREGSCPRRAIEDLRLLRLYDPLGLWSEERSTVLEWMSLCGDRYRRDRMDLARELAEEDPRSPNRPPEIRYMVAAIYAAEAETSGPGREAGDLRDAALQQLERYREECVTFGRRPKVAALRLQAELYRARGDLAEAIAVFQELIEGYPGVPEAAEAERVVGELQLEVELARLEKEQGGRPSAEAEASYQIADAALRRGDLGLAEAELRKAVEDAPWFPKAHYALGLVHARNRRFTDAVEELKLAVRMDRYDYEAHIALGLLYKKEFAGAEDAAAIDHLKRALVLRPDLNNLHLLLGELYARSDRDLARRHYELFLQNAADDDPERERAQTALKNLSHELRVEDPLFEIQPPTDLRRLDPGLQRMINEAYLRHEDDDDWDQAERILEEARRKYPDEPQVLNELAMVAYADGRPGDARLFWEESLGKDADQVDVHERLGILLRSELPEEASAHLRRAAELGSRNARFHLASLLWEENELREAAAQLDLYISEAGPYDLFYDRALLLRGAMDTLFTRIYLVAGGVLLSLLTILGVLIFRRLRGASLDQLLARAPKSFPEVARILSLIRHEILKHNTAFLVDVGRALEFDEADAEVRAAIVARRLFGGGSGRKGRAKVELASSSRDQGIYGRFLGYVLELEKVGRAHGVTLNLQRKDPIFSPMIRAFEDLRVLGEIQEGRGDLRSRKLELAQRLTRSGNELGRRAFERLSSLIQTLCVVDVTPTMIREVFGLVAAESQFARAQIAEVEVAGEGAKIRVFRTDLEDILTNVLRNSLHSSVLYGPSPTQIGVDLVTECDEITGLTTLAIRIKDRSSEQLSDEMLRGRYVERGMGITVDLLSRYDGAIAVEPEPGWQKAVVLRFFTVEETP
ncbi:MAG: tetratricopeptide repeat protein [Myxococcales bacterium]|nr:tetratricopeptide repeat protein [Myxococcales bacterium]